MVDGARGLEVGASSWLGTATENHLEEEEGEEEGEEGEEEEGGGGGGGMEVMMMMDEEEEEEGGRRGRRRRRRRRGRGRGRRGKRRGRKRSERWAFSVNQAHSYFHTFLPHLPLVVLPDLPKVLVWHDELALLHRVIDTL